MADRPTRGAISFCGQPQPYGIRLNCKDIQDCDLNEVKRLLCSKVAALPNGLNKLFSWWHSYQPIDKFDRRATVLRCIIGATDSGDLNAGCDLYRALTGSTK